MALMPRAALAAYQSHAPAPGGHPPGHHSRYPRARGSEKHGDLCQSGPRAEAPGTGQGQCALANGPDAFVAAKYNVERVVAVAVDEGGNVELLRSVRP